jgi:hypothetical protein
MTAPADARDRGQDEEPGSLVSFTSAEPPTTRHPAGGTCPPRRPWQHLGLNIELMRSGVGCSVRVDHLVCEPNDLPLEARDALPYHLIDSRFL